MLQLQPTPHFIWFNIVLDALRKRLFFFLLCPVYKCTLSSPAFLAAFLGSLKVHEFICCLTGGARRQRGERTYRKTRREGQQMWLFPCQLIQTPRQSVADDLNSLTSAAPCRDSVISPQGTTGHDGPPGSSGERVSNGVIHESLAHCGIVCFRASILHCYYFVTVGTSRTARKKRRTRTERIECEFWHAHSVLLFIHADISSFQSFRRCFVFVQGPAGKDGLPGHPGQRGEPVSKMISMHARTHAHTLH